MTPPPAPADDTSPDQPIIILVAPQLGDNIGAAARAMLNFGLTRMRIVNPRDGWPNERAVANASGATEVLDKAEIFDSFADAIADCHKVYATTARRRELKKPVISLEEVRPKFVEDLGKGLKVAVAFGAERAGLENDDIALCDAILTIPINRNFSSINLAQSVLLVGYEWFRTAPEAFLRAVPEGEAPQLATKKELQGLFEQFEEELVQSGFLFPIEMRPHMIRNLRTMFMRAELLEQEVRTLRGAFKSLVRYGAGQGLRNRGGD